MLNFKNEEWQEPRLSESDFAAFFETNKQAMFVENRDGYVIAINPAACELWGSKFNDLVGKHASEILPPRLGAAAIGQVRRSHYSRPDGEKIEVEVLATPLSIGEDEAFLTMVWPADESGSKLDAVLVADESSGETARDQIDLGSLERFSEKVSHDFNNLLTSVVGFSSLMQSDETLSEANREFLDQIIEAANRAAQMTAELVSFGRRGETAKTPIQLDKVLGAAEPKLKEILGDQITFSSLCEQELPSVLACEQKIASLLEEFARNAHCALEGSAEGSFKIELEADAEGKKLVLRATDDGVGMDEATSAAACEPFFTTHADKGQKGLGLARAYATVRDLGGSMSIASRHGEGSTFTVRFPVAERPEIAPLPPLPEPAHETLETLPDSTTADPQAAEAEAPEQPAAEPKTEEPTDSAPEPAEAPEPEESPADEPKPEPAKANTKKGGLPCGTETILVVEDEPMVREIVVRSLTHLGYTVHKASDGQEGLEKSRELADEIDLIFSDIVMPRLSGPEMIEKVREENRSTPVLFTTGFTESKHLLENGGDLREGVDLLQKPYTPNVLAERLREKLDSLVS